MVKNCRNCKCSLPETRKTPYCTTCKNTHRKTTDWVAHTCSRCRKPLPEGRKQAYCPSCMTAYNAEHRKERNEYYNGRRKTDPKYRESQRQRESRRHFRDKARSRERWNDWRARNPLKDIARQQRRRARLLGAEGSFTKDDLLRIYESQGWKCAHCGEQTKLTADHIVPLSKGGSNWPENIQGLCKPCNSRKHDRLEAA